MSRAQDPTMIAQAARQLEHRIRLRLFEKYPDGNFEKSYYYREELRHYLKTLGDIGDRKHEFGKYVCRLGWDFDQRKYILEDLYFFLGNFLNNGTIQPLELTREERNSSISRSEYLVMLEMFGALLKRDNPNIRHEWRAEPD